VAAFTSNVLLDDPDLGSGLSGSRLRMAQRDLVAVAILIEGRHWEPDEDAAAARGGIGLLILDGIIVRRVGRQGRFGAELLGRGDLVRPWQHDGDDETLPFDTDFRIVEPTQMAVLDLRFTARLAPYPEVVAGLVGRAMQRSRTLAVNMAIAHHTRVDRRLLMLFWHLAERWGRVTPEGIRIPLPVTHQVLADLVASRRPSVTTALSQLQEEGRVARAEDGWLLLGDAPRELYEPVGSATAPAGPDEPSGDG
jgi:CRP/FNR family transcriptional regulator, cyclic AMP receptor protein